MRIPIRTCLALMVSLAFCGFAQSQKAAAQDREWEAGSNYYEDDAWYDITEWFDGNDYNPTDESFGVWNDEVYGLSDDTGTDVDNDTWYGYYDYDADEDWFYDYYDPGIVWDNDYDNFAHRYYDYDNDGLYDAVVSYSDWDNDGLYEDVAYYSFNEAGTDAQRDKVKQQTPANAGGQMVRGSIENLKEVQVRGNKHLVAAFQTEGKEVFADLGPAGQLTSLNLKKGDQIEARGPVIRVGDKTVIVAQSVDAKNQTKQINRQRRTIQGEVVSTHTSKVRGSEHLIAMVNSPQQKQNVAVDLGPVKKLKAEVRKGSQLTFTAVPVKVKDRRMLIAQTIQQNGETLRIARQPASKSGS